MLVGKNVTVRPDDEAGAFALHRRKTVRKRVRVIFIRLILEKEIVQRRTVAGITLLRHFDDDDARGDDIENVGKGVVKLMDDILALRGRGGRHRWSGLASAGAGCATRAEASGRERKRAKQQSHDEWSFGHGVGATVQIVKEPRCRANNVLSYRQSKCVAHAQVPSLTRLLRPLAFFLQTKMVTLASEQKDGKAFLSHAPGYWSRDGGIAPGQWNDWKWQLQNRVTSLAQLEQHLVLSDEERSGVLLSGDKLALAVTPHFFNLIPRDNPD